MILSVEKCRLIADLCHPVEVRIFVTTANWARIAGDIEANYTDSLIMPSGRPTPKNFQALKIRSAMFVNSGTDDQTVCNILNAPEEARTQFRYREANYAVRRSA